MSHIIDMPLKTFFWIFKGTSNNGVFKETRFYGVIKGTWSISTFIASTVTVSPGCLGGLLGLLTNYM